MTSQVPFFSLHSLDQAISRFIVNIQFKEICKIMSRKLTFSSIFASSVDNP